MIAAIISATLVGMLVLGHGFNAIHHRRVELHKQIVQQTQTISQLQAEKAALLVPKTTPQPVMIIDGIRVENLDNER